MTYTRQWKFMKHPTGPVKLDGPDKSFELVEAVLPAPKADELLVKLVSLSNDPILRNWMSPDIDPVRFYTKPLLIGDVVSAYGLAVVEKSPSKAFTEGQLVIAQTGWSEKAIVPVATTLVAAPLDSISSELRPTQYLSTLGMPGLTAWFSITDTLKATPDDVLLVSGAAGAVGSLAVQIAKKVIGCRKVIAIAGGSSKCRWVESLGADICLDYKSASFGEDLKAVTPPEDFVTAFHDNVGGQTLQMVIDRMARHGRISACGEISSYNDASAGIKNWLEIIRMRLVITGIVIFDWEKQFGDGIAALTKALAEGKLDVSGSEHIVEATFEEVPAVWMTLFEGANRGKLITRLS